MNLPSENWNLWENCKIAQHYSSQLADWVLNYAGMKPAIMALCLCLPLAGADKKPLTKEESAKVIEKAIRTAAKKPTGALTKADLEKVTTLFFGGNKLTDVKGLEKLTELEVLYLQNNQLTSVKGLEKLTQLKGLLLSNNQLTNVKGLEKLTQLKWLELHKNQLTDVKGLEKLTQLTILRVDDNQLTDVKGLEKLNQLTRLGLEGNQLTDVKGLEKLTQLTHLVLEDNPDLTKAQVSELKKALPKCRISSNPKK